MVTVGSSKRLERPTQRPRPVGGNRSMLQRFVTAQSVNAVRNAAALRPFSDDEFGRDAASPSKAHIQAANTLIARLRRGLLQQADRLSQEQQIGGSGVTPEINGLLTDKERSTRWAKLVERIWDYYLELFGQRQTRFAPMLLATDRIGLDCYQAIYTGLKEARSIPAPPPFSYMETGHTPSIFRRGVAMSRLGKHANPFPVIQLPYHRLVNPWTLGAVHHEVSHNLQSDLGLWNEVPQRITQRLHQSGMAPSVARTWARWHKEIWADLCGLLLGGPANVASLIDVLARSPRSTMAFNPMGVHPTPYLRTFINLELLKRMGFGNEATQYRHLWQQLYPAISVGTIPSQMLRSFPRANQLVVDTICFQPYHQLGGRSLSEVTRFRPTHQAMTQEAGQRLATGTDPGIIPVRFLVGAARYALDQRLASPGQITRHFYQALSKR